MADLKDTYREVFETWRFQVNSYWQRSSYFAAFETALLVGYWVVLQPSGVPRWLTIPLGFLGLGLTLVWFLNNLKTHAYVRHWWESLLALERELGMRRDHTDFAGQIEGKQKNGLQYRTLMQVIPVLFLCTWAGLAAYGLTKDGSFLRAVRGKNNAISCNPLRGGYFDAHNHSINAILPYYAYADLNAFIVSPADPTKVDLEHRRELWSYIVSSGIKCKAKTGTESSCRTGPGNRVAPGAIATLKTYGTNIRDLTALQINGSLERVLTATPWTEFDSAYLFRGEPVEAYLRAYFDHDRDKMRKALCDAAVLELAVTNTAYSEQFVNFIKEWNIETVAGHKVSPVLDTIRCFADEPKVLETANRLGNWQPPTIKVLLMTHTSELGAISDNISWMQYGEVGQCKPTESSEKLFRTQEHSIEHALLGQEPIGELITRSDERSALWNTVIGVDTAGPEITCFTSQNSKDNKGPGMDNYKRLVTEVYLAARARRRAGWHGKLLVHTHVGEGAVTYRLPTPSPSLKSPFEKFPDVWMDNADIPTHAGQAAKNIKILLEAVRELKEKYKDIDNYVVFRFGHVTHADISDAQEMKKLGVEADINLESNVSTGAFYSKELEGPVPVPLEESQQFERNDLPSEMFRSGRAVEILSEHSLRYMLAAGVRTLLGSDGGGVEHSDIGREYELASELIQYWKEHDEHFPREISIDTVNRNVEMHLQDMRTDSKCN